MSFESPENIQNSLSWAVKHLSMKEQSHHLMALQYLRLLLGLTGLRSRGNASAYHTSIPTGQGHLYIPLGKLRDTDRPPDMRIVVTHVSNIRQFGGYHPPVGWQHRVAALPPLPPCNKAVT